MTVRRSTQEFTFNDTTEQFVENAAVFYNHQVTEEVRVSKKLSPSGSVIPLRRLHIYVTSFRLISHLPLQSKTVNDSKKIQNVNWNL